MLDYGEISERESTVIGRKGKRAYPPQFQFPISVAADGLGNVYVADYGNARIQVFDVDGNIAREPLNMGGKCRPCALAVSSRGDLVVADCQILRVLSKKGSLVLSVNFFLLLIFLFKQEHDNAAKVCNPRSIYNSVIF